MKCFLFLEITGCLCPPLPRWIMIYNAHGKKKDCKKGKNGEYKYDMIGGEITTSITTTTT